jgi:hypothetical protein
LRISKIKDAIWRGFLGLGRLLVAWIPALILLFMGGLYLYNCLEVLAAPGTGFDLSYVARGGVVRIKSESYSIDPVSQSIEATGISVFDQSGELIGSAKKLRVERNSGSIEAQLADLTATIIRRKDGTFSALDYLPPENPDSKPTSFHLTANKALITLEDQSQPQVLRDEFALTGIDFSTDGLSNVLSSDLNWPKTLSARIQARIDGKNNFAVQVDALKADLVKARPTVSRWLPEEWLKQADAWKADELLVDGSLSFKGNPKSVRDIHGEFAIHGERVRNPEFLSNALIDGRVSLFSKSALVTAKVSEPGRTLSWDGPVSWSDGLAGQGKVQVRLADGRRAWPIVAKSLPKDVQLLGSEFNGVVGLSKLGFSASGKVSAKSASVAGERFEGLTGDIIADKDRVSFVLDGTKWRGAGVKGWITADYQGKFLTGLFETMGDKLVALEFPVQQGKVSMAARSKALLSGTPRDPRILVDLTGFAQLELPDRKVLLGEVDARVNWKDSVATLDRAVLTGPNGVINASGNVNTATNSLNLELEAAGIDLSAWSDQVSGVGYGSGRITGSTSAPVVTMNTTLLNLQAGGVTIPKGTALLTYSGSELLASDIQVVYGLGMVGGQASIELKSGALNGLLQAKDIFVADLLPNVPIVGRVGADQILLSGTIDDPNFSVNATGSDLLIEGVQMNDVQLTGKGNLREFTLTDAVAKIDDGTITAKGYYSLEKESGRLNYEVDSLPLKRLPVDQELLEFDGTVTGKGVVETNSMGKWVGSTDLQLIGVHVNQFDAGNGSLAVTIQNDVISLSGGISSLNGLIEIPEATFNLENKDFDGDLLITNVELAGVLRAVSKQIKLPDIQTERVVRDLEGLLSAEILFQQRENRWAVDVKSLTGQNLASLGRKLGNVELVGKGSALEATVEKLRWTIPDEETSSVAELSGSWNKGETKDSVDVQGRLVEFDPYTLNLFWLDGPEYHAKLNADFIASGPTDDLSAQASLTASDIQVKGADGEMVKLPVSANVDTIDLSNNLLTASGKLKYQGIEGDLNATVPLGAFSENPTEDAEASLSLSQRPISSLKEYVTGLDFERTRGAVSGRLSISGNRNGYVLGGVAKFGADSEGPAQIAFENSNFSLQNVDVSLSNEGEKLSLVGQGDGSLGGQVAVRADLNLRRFLQGKMDIESLSAASLEGASIRFDQLKLSEKIRLANPGAGVGEPPVLEASSPTTGELNGEVLISGTVGKPVIGGEVSARNLNIALPPSFPESQGGKRPEFDPRFDNFRLVAMPGAILNIPTGNLKLSGTTVLNGDLSEIDIRAPFTVESGTLNLPASRVTLEEGTVLVTAGFGGDPRAEIDLRGWTVVTARRTSDQYQTYRLNLEVQGNLLDPEGVRINGSSDPPDLSIEEIRAIVGQRDFIQSLVDTALGTGDRRTGITSSVFTLAIPSLTQRFTSELATALDLDYLALDYNAFDGAIVRGGREMSKGLMLEFSRQISQQNNQALKFELRLSYRPPTKNDFLSRFRITAGVTETLPWKVGISWSSKF